MLRRCVIAGLASAALYLVAVLGPLSLLAHATELTDLGKLTGYDPVAGALVTGGLIALFGLYGFGLLNVPDGDSRGLAVVLGGTALLSAALIFLYPAMAIDVYNYTVEGYVAAVYHSNPFVMSPAAGAGYDDFVAYAGTWAQSPSPYGPIWILIARAAAPVAGRDVLLWVVLLKAIEALSVLGTTILIAVAFADRGRRAQAVAAMLFGWNPLVQIELVGNGHNDAVLTLLLVGGLLLFQRKHRTLGILAVGGAILIKPLAIGVLPLFLLAIAAERGPSTRRKLTQMATSVAVLSALAVGAYAPFWIGPATLHRILAVDTDYVGSIAALAISLFPSTVGWLVYPRLAVAVVVGLWQARVVWRDPTKLPKAALEILIATILLSTHFAGWYLALPLALAILTGEKWQQARLVIFTLTATLTTPEWAYLWWWTKDLINETTFHLIIVPLTFLPPMLLVLPRKTRWIGGLVKTTRATGNSIGRFGSGQPEPAPVTVLE